MLEEHRTIGITAALLLSLAAGCGGEPAEETAAPHAPETAASTAKDTRVLLGSPELTAGVPGSGPLTVDEVKAWLDDPANHVELEIELPLGLADGMSNVTGIDVNPLTRAKIELGRQLYFDARLSADGKVSCATCHAPETGYTAATQFGVGIDGQTGNRNSPVAYNRIQSGPQFWDGRAATLEEQAVGPIANPIEMGNTHTTCVATLGKIEGYALQFERIFGGVTIEAVGQAIASFERVIVTGPSPFDHHEEALRYADVTDDEIAEDAEYKTKVDAARKAAAANPMSEAAVRGRELYFGKASCSACHAGANLADEQYHNLGVGMDAEKPDLGRFEVTKQERDRGAFKTPTVRNVEMSAPYMHDGSQATLEAVVDWYDKGGHANPHLSDKIKPLGLSSQEKTDLVAFMKACTGPLPKVEQGRLPE